MSETLLLGCFLEELLVRCAFAALRRHWAVTRCIQFSGDVESGFVQSCLTLRVSVCD